jgi:hypothetical protein
VGIADVRDALIMRALAALIRGRHQAHQGVQLPPVLDLPPPKEFGGQRPGADRADPAEGGQSVDIPAQRGLRIRRERRALGVQFLERAVQELELRPDALQPGFQPGGDRRPIPPTRRLELRREIRLDRQRESLRGHKPFQGIDQPIPILLCGLPRPMELPCILFVHARHAHDPPALSIALLMAREPIQEAPQIEAVRLHAARPPIDLNARLIDHVIAHGVRHHEPFRAIRRANPLIMRLGKAQMGDALLEVINEWNHSGNEPRRNSRSDNGSC